MITAQKNQSSHFKPSPLLKEQNTVLGIDINNSQELIRSVRDGIPTTYAIKLQKAFDVTPDVFGKTAGISAKTISRRKEGLLKKEQSERIIRLARLFDRAVIIFQDIEQVRLWFKTPNEALGGETPMNYSDTELGAQEVADLLGRIEHGVFS